MFHMNGGKTNISETILFVFKMREAAHENINTFMGACFNAPHVCLLYSYCSKGSLQVIKIFHIFY